MFLSGVPQAARLDSLTPPSTHLPSCISYYHGMLPNVSQICPVLSVCAVQVFNAAHLGAFHSLLGGLPVSHCACSNNSGQMPLGPHPSPAPDVTDPSRAHAGTHTPLRGIPRTPPARRCTHLCFFSGLDQSGLCGSCTVSL